MFVQLLQREVLRPKEYVRGTKCLQRENSQGLLSVPTRNSGVEGGVTAKAGITELKTQWGQA